MTMDRLTIGDFIGVSLLQGNAPQLDDWLSAQSLYGHMIDERSTRLRKRFTGRPVSGLPLRCRSRAQVASHTVRSTNLPRDDALHFATLSLKQKLFCIKLHNAKKYFSGTIMPIAGRAFIRVPF
jgi:hypothetical protein